MLLELFIICFAAAITPGPDVLMILKNTLNYGFKMGIATALGISSSLSLHLTYTNMGLLFFIKKNAIIFKSVSVIGFAYLSYIAFAALFSKKQDFEYSLNNKEATYSFKKCYKNGFLTNALNPNVPFFFLFLFSQVINQDSSSKELVIYCLDILLATFSCFCLVASIVSFKHFRKIYFKFAFVFNKIFALAIIYFAFKILKNVFT